MLYDFIFLLAGLVGGGLISGLVSHRYYRKQLADYEKQKDEEIARYVVMAMSHKYPPRNSQELQQRVDKYLEALRRTKEDKRGVPIYREDGSIGVDWSLHITGVLHVSGSVSAQVNQHNEYE